MSFATTSKLELKYLNDCRRIIWYKICTAYISLINHDARCFGQGEKLFDEGTIPATFILTESSITQGGVILTNYKRAGEVRTGTVGD